MIQKLNSFLVLLAFAGISFPVLAQAKVINCYGVDSNGNYIQVLDVGNPEGTRILGYVTSSADPSKVGLKLERTVKLTRSNTADVNADPVYTGTYPNIETPGHYELTVDIPAGKTSGTGKLVDSGGGFASLPYRFEYPLSCGIN